MIHLSVVIPTYNRPLLLKRSIKSVLKQVHHERFFLEIIVVDDGSYMPVDLAAFEGENIRYLRLKQNSGPQVARNKGIEMAEGDWIVMLDDDDELLPDTLENAIHKIRSLERHEHFPVFFFATTNGRIPTPFAWISTEDFLNRTLKGDFTPVIQRKVFSEKGFAYRDYPEILGVGCELLTWLEISQSVPIPTFRNTLIKVNEDAPLRLSSYDNFIRNSGKFALQQDITIDFLKSRRLDITSPWFTYKKFLGAATYYLLSGERAVCRERLKYADGFRVMKWVIHTLSFMPIPLSRFLFRYYKLRISN